MLARQLPQSNSQRRYERYRVGWPGELQLDNGMLLKGMTRDYCQGGVFLAVPVARLQSQVRPDMAGQLTLYPADGAAVERLPVVIRRVSPGGIGVEFGTEAGEGTKRLLELARADNTTVAETLAGVRPESPHRALVRGRLEHHAGQWAGAWVASLSQRLFAAAREASASQQHRMMDAHQSLVAAQAELPARMVARLLAAFDAGHSATAVEGQAALDTLTLIGKEEFEDFLAEAEITARVETAHRERLFTLRQRLETAFQGAFGSLDGPLSPQSLVHALWDPVRHVMESPAIRVPAQGVFLSELLQRIGEFYREIDEALAEAGVEVEAPGKVVIKRPASAALRPSAADVRHDERSPDDDEDYWPADAANANDEVPRAHSAGQRRSATRPARAPAWEDLAPRTLPEDHTRPTTVSPVGLEAGAAEGAPSLARLYGLLEQLTQQWGGSAANVATTRPASQTSPLALGRDTDTEFPELLPTMGHLELAGLARPRGPAVMGAPSPLDVASEPAEPTPRAPSPEQGVAPALIQDLFRSLATDERLPELQQSLVSSLRPAVEALVHAEPDSLVRTNSPVRRCLEAVSQLVWTDGPQAVGLCGLEASALIERLSDPASATPALFEQVADELDALVAQQRRDVDTKVRRLIEEAEQQQSVLASRRLTGEASKPQAAVPEELAPWVEVAKALPVGAQFLQSKPKGSDALLELAWIGQDYNPFLFVDPAGDRGPSMSLQELAVQLCKGRLRRVEAKLAPVQQAVLGLVDQADQRLQTALSRYGAEDVWSELGVLGALDACQHEPAQTRPGAVAPPAYLARWRRRDRATGQAPDWSPLKTEIAQALPTGTQLARLDDGDLLAFAGPGLADATAWQTAVAAVNQIQGLDSADAPLQHAASVYRPDQERPGAALERLAAECAGVSGAWLAPLDEADIQAALDGEGPYTLVTDLAPILDPDGRTVAWALAPRVLERQRTGPLGVGGSAPLAARFDRWMTNAAVERLAARDLDDETLLLVPLSDLAPLDLSLVNDIGECLLNSGIPPALIMFSIGLRSADERAALQSLIDGLLAYGARVAVRYRHGVGLTAVELKASRASCMQLPDWLTEPVQQGALERRVMLQSLVELCRFIGVQSLGVVEGEGRALEELRALGLDWVQQAVDANDATISLAVSGYRPD